MQPDAVPSGAPVDHAGRRQRLAERLGRRNLDGWILVPGPNLRYFTGLLAEPSERVFLCVVPAAGPPFAVVPHFELGRVRPVLQAMGGRVTGYRDETGPEPAVARAFSAFGTRAVLGAEFGAMRLFERAVVEGAVPRARWHALDADAAALRQVKEPQEARAIREAAAIARCAVAAGVAAAVPGATERDVEAACLAQLHARHSPSPFPVMVASGPRSADPHAVTGDRELRAGDLCWIDLGATVQGYCADITRTVAVGAGLAPALGEAVQAVRSAQAAAIAAVRPGVTAAAVDAAAREAIAAAGLGAYFTHRTGHGLGLQEHEPPYIVDGNEEPLQPGMVFTVEPGVYLPELGGARLEDDVLVTAQGAEVLTAGT